MNISSKWGAGLALVALLQATAWAGNYQVHEVTRTGFDSMWFRDVNNSGQILGGADAGNGLHVSFIYANATYADLPQYGEAGLNFYGRGLSDGGVVVGSAWNKDSFGKGVVYENGGYQVILLSAPLTRTW